MSTALMQLTTGAEMTEYDALIAAELADEPTPQGIQLPRIKIAPGGIGQYQIGDDTAKTFTGIIAIAQEVRGYWPVKDAGNVAPLCSSTDALNGVFNAKATKAEFDAAAGAAKPHPAIIALSHKQTIAPAYSCITCPLAQFDSQHQGMKAGETGKGQACKKMVRMLLLIDGWTMPAVLSLPPTSLKAWGMYFVARQSQRGQAYFTVRTKFELDVALTPSGIKYNTAKFTLADKLTLDEVRLVANIRAEYKAYVRSAAVEAGEYGDGAEQPLYDGTYIEGDATPAPNPDIPF